MKLLDRLFSKRVIVNCDRDPYLIRWYVIRSAAVALFIHKFIRSDEDRALHDHPWNFVVVPIWRGYYEHSSRVVIDTEFGIDQRAEEAVRRRVWPVIGARFRRGTYRHRVELVRRGGNELPSWSIFIRFREFRDWGFWMPEGWVQWNRW
jgi:hypothetical protein